MQQRPWRREPSFSGANFGLPGLAHLTYWRNRDGWSPGLNKYPLTMRQPMLWEQSVHHLDLIRHIYDTDVLTVSATTSNPPWSDYAHDATVCATLTLANDMTVQYTGTWAARTARDSFIWRTDCTRGCARANRSLRRPAYRP